MRKYTLKIPEGRSNYFINYEAELNSEQLEVVTAEGGPMLVIAGAGTGKTRTVTYRVARLLESGVSPENILLVTFTNKAAREMLFRVASLVNFHKNKLWGGTFHHIGNLIMKKEAHLLGYKSNYTILDREDSKSLIGHCIADSGVSPKDGWFPKEGVVSDIVSFAVNTQQEIEIVIKKNYPIFHEHADKIKQIANNYLKRKMNMNLLDFDDLLRNWKLLLDKFPDILEHYSRKFLHILVDEYQDTNRIQADIIDLLSSYHQNIMAVGDDSQSIYSFRGANFANIIEFPNRYSEVKVFKLQTNYRSTPEIINLSNQSIAHNRLRFPKTLKSSRSSGATPALIALYDTLKQADFVSQRILELQDEGISLNEISILYRAHYHSMEIQMELTRRGIPFEIRSGLKFFEQAHIKDVTSFLRIVSNPFDEIAWKRIVRLYPRIGNTTANKIWNFISSTQEPLASIASKELANLIPKGAKKGITSFLSLLKGLKNPDVLNLPSRMIYLVMENGYKEYLQVKYHNFESRIDDLNQLASYSLKYRTTEDFLKDLALMGIMTVEDMVFEEQNDERVTLSSVHQAKGLEWSAVFIIWCAEGKFPLARGLKEKYGEEEERRLFYVATTRAKDELYLCYPLKGQGRGFHEILLEPSRFIRELEGNPYEEWGIEESIGSDDFSF